MRVRPGETDADYLLPWRVADLDGARVCDFEATRGADGAWTLARRGGPAEPVLRTGLDGLHEAVVRVAAGAEGVVARWHERGTEAEVQAIAAVLARLREACAAER